jgi:hypothetical protein
VRRTLLLISIAAAILASACVSRRIKPVSERQIKTDQIIAGRVLDVHMIGEMEETVMVCDFDPQYAVAVQTETGVKKLAIHSPAKAFMAADPVGKSYRLTFPQKSGHMIKFHEGAFHTALGSYSLRLNDSSDD